MLWSFSPSLGQCVGGSRSVSPDPPSPIPPSPWTDPVLPQVVWRDPRLSCTLLWILRNFDRSWLGRYCCLHQPHENDLEWKWTFSFLCSTWRGSLPVEDGIVASVAYRKIKKVIIIFLPSNCSFLLTHCYLSLLCKFVRPCFIQINYDALDGLAKWLFFSVQLEKLKKLTLVTNNDKNITPLMLG